MSAQLVQNFSPLRSGGCYRGCRRIYRSIEPAEGLISQVQSLSNTEKWPMEFVKPTECGEHQERPVSQTPYPFSSSDHFFHHKLVYRGNPRCLPIDSLCLPPSWAYSVETTQAVIVATLLQMPSTYLSRNLDPSLPHHKLTITFMFLI